MPDQEVTLGEVARSLQELRQDVREIRGVVAERDDLHTVTESWKAALSAHERHAETRIATIESDVQELRAWQTWAGRLVLGAVVLAIITALLSLGGPYA